MDENEEKTYEWAAEEFGKAELGDKRRTKRLVQLAAQRASRPNSSIGQSCGSKAATKAAYRLLDNEDIEAEAIQNSHRRATMERMKAERVVLAIQDTTYLDYTSHPATKGLGYLSDLTHQGLLVHTTLVVTPQRLALGILEQRMWVRKPEEYQEKRRKRKELSTVQKESYKWLQSLAACQQVQALVPSTHIVNIGDCEADIFDLFHQALQIGQDLVVRGVWDRRIEPAGGHLREYVARQAVAGTVAVAIPRRPGKKARTASLSLRYAAIQVRAPLSRRKEKLPSVPIWAILGSEDNPPSGEEKIDWLLLTTLPITTPSEAFEKIQWYTCRWVIEMYHKVLKSGCRVEERQFANLDNLSRYLALDAVIAWRILYLTFLNREKPNLPASALLETFEWQALFCFVHQTNHPPQAPPALHEIILWIAQLGGFMGRVSDGNPGITVIWRGLQRLADISQAWLVFHGT
jgi:hypothetical protein